MAIEILMPALSPTMEEGKLARWLVKEGDEISAGDVIAEIETDKATMEVEAIEDGLMAKLLVAEGAEGVKVNTPIALVTEEGEDPSEVKAPAPVATPTVVEKTPVASSSRRCCPPQRWRARTMLNRQELQVTPPWSRSACVKRCAMPWPKKCAAMMMCL